MSAIVAPASTPLISASPGFTPSRRSEAGCPEFSRMADAISLHLLVTSSVQAFVRQMSPTMPSADFCTTINTPFDGFSPAYRTTAQISRGKFDRLHRTPAEFTTPVVDDCGLCDPLLARPAGQASLFGSCSSGRGFAPRFLQTLPRGNALALR